VTILENFRIIGVLLLAYLIGAIPFGMITVFILTGKDIRKVASGRMGGTNAMRAAGVPAGVVTGIMDVLKGFGAVLLARQVFPSSEWMHILAPLSAILGHNYSIFLVDRTADHRLRLGGGAGGATCLGGILGLWLPSGLIILPIGLAIWYGVGYASVTTLSIGFLAAIIFGVRADQGLSPWLYMLYGLSSEVILLWALRPNLVRLRNGSERLVGWRARRRATQTAED
jgi:glycerol-3-phosphate acyltransferase PlsY